MKTFEILIKSHCNYPDYEDTCEAKNIEEAAKIFFKRLRGEWGKEELKKYIYKENGV